MLSGPARGMVLVALLAASCDMPAGDGEEAVRVVTTVSPITNIVQNVGGDRIRVTGIVPEGIDSHTFEPAPGDARLMAEADVVFVNGLNLELPTVELAEANVREGVEVVELGNEAISPEEYVFDFSFPEQEGDPNPHLWTNPLHAREYAGIVRDRLIALDPDGRETYEWNHRRFAARTDELDRLVREVTETVPAGNRRLLTYHDSFPYFAEEYGWEIIGAIQPSDFSEPTPREVARLIEQVRGTGVPAIFGSEVFPSPVLERIAAETGARYVDDLRDDDLPGSAGDPGHSYIGLMVFNYRTFMGALGGDPSPFDAIDTSNLTGDCCAEYRE